MARPNERAWQELEADREVKLPTPPVGATVQWYLRGDKNEVSPAIVTGIEAPGRLQLCVFPKNSFPQHKTGVYYVDHRAIQDRSNPHTPRCGSWGLDADFEIPVAWYKIQQQDLARRENMLTEAEKTAKKNADLFAKKQAERENGAPKRRLETVQVNAPA